MPAHASDATSLVDPAEIVTSGVACPQPIARECEADGAQEVNTMSPPADDNTAAGMSFAQECSMYEEEKDTKAYPADDLHLPITPISLASPASTQKESARTPSPDLPPSKGFTLSSADHQLNRASDAKAWDFSKKRIGTRCPSALFQNGSRYAGTQQSDRQIYNVEVTILTVDMEQCTMSGYLQICGLTPDHPTLTTFFTGEIIGGPDQKYSFRTKHPSWAASDKTDMTHWARFPAWRPLSQFAKADMNFNHPIDSSAWWQQEHIFMRWKEHFLVPDYKLRSIQGASFEGFYYICLNQIDGRISGIYFHSKSEK